MKVRCECDECVRTRGDLFVLALAIVVIGMMGLAAAVIFLRS